MVGNFGVRPLRDIGDVCDIEYRRGQFIHRVPHTFCSNGCQHRFKGPRVQRKFTANIVFLYGIRCVLHLPLRNVEGSFLIFCCRISGFSTGVEGVFVIRDIKHQLLHLV